MRALVFILLLPIWFANPVAAVPFPLRHARILGFPRPYESELLRTDVFPFLALLKPQGRPEEIEISRWANFTLKVLLANSEEIQSQSEVLEQALAALYRYLYQLRDSEPPNPAQLTIYKNFYSLLSQIKRASELEAKGKTLSGVERFEHFAKLTAQWESLAHATGGEVQAHFRLRGQAVEKEKDHYFTSLFDQMYAPVTAVKKPEPTISDQEITGLLNQWEALGNDDAWNRFLLSGKLTQEKVDRMMAVLTKKLTEKFKEATFLGKGDPREFGRLLEARERLEFWYVPPPLYNAVIRKGARELWAPTESGESDINTLLYYIESSGIGRSLEKRKVRPGEDLFIEKNNVDRLALKAAKEKGRPALEKMWREWQENEASLDAHLAFGVFLGRASTYTKKNPYRLLGKEGGGKAFGALTGEEAEARSRAVAEDPVAFRAARDLREELALRRSEWKEAVWNRFWEKRPPGNRLSKAQFDSYFEVRNILKPDGQVEFSLMPRPEGRLMEMQSYQWLMSRTLYGRWGSPLHFNGGEAPVPPVEEGPFRDLPYPSSSEEKIVMAAVVGNLEPRSAGLFVEYRHGVEAGLGDATGGILETAFVARTVLVKGAGFFVSGLEKGWASTAWSAVKTGGKIGGLGAGFGLTIYGAKAATHSLEDRPVDFSVGGGFGAMKEGALLGLFMHFNKVEMARATEAAVSSASDNAKKGYAASATVDAVSLAAPFSMAWGRRRIDARGESSARVEVAEKLLGRKLSTDQATALQKSHEVGKGETGVDGKPAGLGRYTPDQLQKKYSTLAEVEFTKAEIKILMDRGIVGEPVAPEWQRSVDHIFLEKPSVPLVTLAGFGRGLFKVHVDGKSVEIGYGGSRISGGLHSYEAFRSHVEVNQLARTRVKADARKAQPGDSADSAAIREKAWDEPFQWLDSIQELPVHPNGVRRVLLDRGAFKPDAWRLMLLTEQKGNHGTYVAGGKTLFPETWTKQDIVNAGEKILAEKPSLYRINRDSTGTITGFMLRGEFEAHGVKVKMEIATDAAGKPASLYPLWDQ